MKPLLSLFHSEWIEIRGGRITAVKGRFSQRTLSDLGDVFASHPELRGHIRSNGGGRYTFSGGIPEPLHQRARNVLASR
ncbi:hypothetical protein [Luteolibacter sp. LG18]|uniref:hypothetical protein n=1 Tax=Luteolibacter sp. LG18 TaxID=2819286 RepID=UPI002B326211|nr:hypothetical protein llg_06900 [Luteolibacter sp. LG18]